MPLGPGADLLALRDQVRSYFAELVTPELRAEVDDAPGPLARAAVRRMGTDGWLGYGFPEALGGQGHTPVEQQIVLDEAQAAGAPVPLMTIATIAPTIVRFGTPALRSTMLPRVFAGEIQFAVDEGSGAPANDVGAESIVRPQAVRDGDEWIVNGETTSARVEGDADAVWLTCRTDPDAAGADGISLLIVAADIPGVAAIEKDSESSGRAQGWTYDNVRVPVDRLVGDVGGGADVTAHRREYERAVAAWAGWMVRHHRDVVEWAQRTTRADGRRVIDEEWVQISLARIHAGLECLTLLNQKVAWSAAHDSASAVDVAASKVFGTELFVEATGLLMEIVGPEATLVDARAVALQGRLEATYRAAIARTCAGGSNDAPRDLIASGLGPASADS